MKHKLWAVIAACVLFTGCAQSPAETALVPSASPETERLAGTKLTNAAMFEMFQRLDKATIFTDDQGVARPFELWRNVKNQIVLYLENRDHPFLIWDPVNDTVEVNYTHQQLVEYQEEGVTKQAYLELICDGFQASCTAAVTTSTKTTRWPVEAPDERVSPALAKAVQQAAKLQQDQIEQARQQADKALFELRTVYLNTQDYEYAEQKTYSQASNGFKEESSATTYTLYTGELNPTLPPDEVAFYFAALLGKEFSDPAQIEADVSVMLTLMAAVKTYVCEGSSPTLSCTAATAGNETISLNLPQAAADDLLAVIQIMDLGEASQALLGRTLSLNSFDQDGIRYDADTLEGYVLIRGAYGMGEEQAPYEAPMTLVLNERTEGQRLIRQYVQVTEIENSAFVRDDQGNEYYLPMIQETLQAEDCPLVIWETACESNADASQLYRLVYQKPLR